MKSLIAVSKKIHIGLFQCHLSGNPVIFIE